MSLANSSVARNPCMGQSTGRESNETDGSSQPGVELFRTWCDCSQFSTIPVASTTAGTTHTRGAAYAASLRGVLFELSDAHSGAF